MKKQIAMFGMTEAEIREQYINSLTARLSGLEMVVAGILSDCQEELCAGPADQARIAKQLNVAKFILFEMLDQKEDYVLANSDV